MLSGGLETAGGNSQGCYGLAKSGSPMATASANYAEARRVAAVLALSGSTTRQHHVVRVDLAGLNSGSGCCPFTGLQKGCGPILADLPLRGVPCGAGAEGLNNVLQE